MGQADRPRKRVGHVCMLVKNSFQYDARVTREATSLVTAGWDVTVIAVHVPGAPRRETTAAGVQVVRVPRIYGRLSGFAGPSTIAPGAASTPARWFQLSPAVLRTDRQNDCAVDHELSSGLRRSLRSMVRVVAAFPRALNNLVLDHRFAAQARALRPSVIHAHDLNTLTAARRVKRSEDAWLVYDAHELQAHRNGMGTARRAWTRIAERRGMRDVDVMITATDAWADYLAGFYKVDRPHVVRNVPERAPPTRRRSLREALMIGEGQRVLVYQGSIQPNRGLEQTIAALHHLPECVLVVIGYGEHRAELQRLAQRVGLSARVRFVGPVPNDELLSYTAGADVGMCCIINSSLSYYWSLPNKVFEYMMAGIPSVTSDFPEMGRFVKEEGIGEVCNPSDVRDISRAVARIIHDPSHEQRLRAAARAAAERHHWGREERRLHEVYAQIPRRVAA